MVKAAVLLALLPAATAFMAPATKAPKIGRGRALNTFGYNEEEGRPVGGVQFFPWDPKPYWDPLNLSKDGDEATVAKLQAAEIKHGRIAMLAALDYIVHGYGVKLSGNLGKVPFADIPGGLAAIKAVPIEGWGQILLAVSALEFLAPQKEGKVPGQVQPDSPSFMAPGDIETRTKEINNGRLAMVSVLGMWVGELINNGQQPFDTLGAIYKISS